MKGDPLSSEASPRPLTEKEVFALATPERFAKYQRSGGNSASMIDHYYDKLLSVARPPPEIVRNPFLERSALESAAPLVKVHLCILSCLEYYLVSSIFIACCSVMFLSMRTVLLWSQVCLEFGATGTVPVAKIEELAVKHGLAIPKEK